MFKNSLRVILFTLILVAAPGIVWGQEVILTAPEYFDTIGKNYASLDDYIATMTYTDEGGELSGTLYFKQPNFVRVDYDNPEDMVLVSNGELFMVYVPAFNVVLQQEIRELPEESETPGGGADLVTPEGLEIMRRNYDIAWFEGTEPVPLDEGSETLVTRLRLDRKQVTEGFRQIVLSIDESGFIRRIDGTKVDWEEVRLDLSDIQINQSIPTARFDYEPEADASILENFLFEPEA